MNRTILCTFAALLVAPGPVLADEHEIIEAMKVLTEKIDRLEKKIAEDALARKVSGNIVPVGAIMAFDLENGCPVGWADYTQGWGRFIIGAVPGNKLGEIPGEFAEDERGVDLTEKLFGKPGGEEKHSLKWDEMPKHSHKLLWGRAGPQDNYYEGSILAGKLRGTPLAQETETAGLGDAHNNLPPYVALYFCKKG